VKRDDRFVPAKDTWFVPRLIQMYWYSRLIQELVLHTTALGVTGVKVAASSRGAMLISYLSSFGSTADTTRFHHWTLLQQRAVAILN
jgi:hypothetical protein